MLKLLFVFCLAEIFSSRWNQLTDKEKNKLKTIVEFRNNLLKIFEAINLGLNNFQNLQNFFKFGKKNENINKKKWVRNDQNDNIQI